MVAFSNADERKLGFSKFEKGTGFASRKYGLLQMLVELLYVHWC